ncbi:hypothetical protein Dimus_010716 [Dionaea muscipula]
MNLRMGWVVRILQKFDFPVLRMGYIERLGLVVLPPVPKLEVVILECTTLFYRGDWMREWAVCEWAVWGFTAWVCTFESNFCVNLVFVWVGSQMNLIDSSCKLVSFGF